MDRYTQRLTQRLALAAKADEDAHHESEKTREQVKNLALLCLDQGLSEYDVSDLAGVTRQTVRAWQGKNEPKRTKMSTPKKTSA